VTFSRSLGNGSKSKASARSPNMFDKGGKVMAKCKSCGKMKCDCKGMSKGGAVKKEAKWTPPWAKAKGKPTAAKAPMKKNPFAKKV